MIDPIVRTVMNLMRQFGGDMELTTEMGEPVYDPTTSTVELQERAWTVRAIVFDYLPKHAGVGLETNSLIRAGDKQVWIMPGDFPGPEAKKSSVIIKGVKYTIQVIKELDPTGSNVIVYECYARV